MTTKTKTTRKIQTISTPVGKVSRMAGTFRTHGADYYLRPTPQQLGCFFHQPSEASRRKKYLVLRKKVKGKNVDLVLKGADILRLNAFLAVVR